ncbi:GNAT family N-acetyltransferase [Actinotalea solisilvae]|uniref:GNAT family N-acetyltransferase n=1 Tax=Actinotalea solisilvae TaxID=2072922 RepID=UPI0018F1238C|nr:GNAT family N-acetyltransferase [Actinotalea solisilvae]
MSAAASPALVAAARTRWAHLAGPDVTFPDDGARVVVAPASRLCPPGWFGVVRVGGATLVSVPDDATAAAVVPLLALDGDDLTDPDAVGAVLRLDAVLGPARLAYLDPAASLPSAPACEAVAVDDPRVTALLATDPDGTDESGLEDAGSPLFVARDGDRLLAAAGYHRWPSDTAHVGVLVAPEARGRRLAAVVGAAASTHAREAGLLPQWRARIPASIRTAATLGYADVGAQLSVRPAP